MTDATPVAGAPYLLGGQAQKHVTANEAFQRLDAALQIGVVDRDLTSPPADPAEGARYLIAAPASGAWAGRDGEIACFYDGAWLYHAPRAGWTIFVIDEDAALVHDGSDWRALGGDVSALEARRVERWGVNADADAVNRLSVNAAATLLNHVGGGHQLKLNKNAAGDVASALFQTGFSGRAEFGTIGDDDFRFKVSADGAAWRDAMTISAADGAVAFGGALRLARYAVATLPAPAAAGAGALAFVADDSGGPTLVFCDGAAWRRAQDRAVVG